MNQLSEKLALVGVVNPASYAAGEQLSAAIPLANLRRIIANISTGVMGASATLDVVFKGAVGAAGTYAAIPNAALTQIVKASGDNVQAKLELSAKAVEDLALGYTHVKLSMTGAVAASIYQATIQAETNRYADATLYDLATVVQTKAL